MKEVLARVGQKKGQQKIKLMEFLKTSELQKKGLIFFISEKVKTLK